MEIIADPTGVIGYSPETGEFCWLKRRRGMRKRVGSFRKDGYLRLFYGGRRVYAHRLAWFIITGSWPIRDMDHVNLDKSDNRWSNLREASKSQNMANVRKRKSNSSGHKGVVFNSKSRKWRARIQSNGRGVHIGCFDSPNEAYKAYLDTARRIYGEFARP